MMVLSKVRIAVTSSRGIAADVLRDVYVRGKYRDVILPMTVIRRLDAVLEPTRVKVLQMKETLDSAGITNDWLEAFLRLEALPYTFDAWYVPSKVKIGCEISFTRHFYKPQLLRPLEEISAEILALERETEGLLGEIMGVRGG